MISAVKTSRLGGNFVWLTGEKLVRWLISIFVGSLVARHLGPHAFGQLGYALAVMALVGSIAGVGIEAILVRELVRRPTQAAQTLATVCMMRFLGGVVAWGVALAISSFSGGENASLFVLIIGSSLVFQAAEVHDAWFTAQTRSKNAVLTRCAIYILFAGLRWWCVSAGFSVSVFVWITAGEALVLACSLYGAYALTGRSPGKWKVSSSLATRILRESWPNILSGLAALVYARADRLILERTSGSEAVGLYTAANTLIEWWYFLPSALVATVFPVLTRYHQADSALFWTRLKQLTQVLALAGWAFVIGIAVAGPWVVQVLFGSSYAQSIQILPVLGVGILFVFLGSAASPWYYIEGQLVLALWRQVTGAIVCLVLNALLTQRYGIMGAAISAMSGCVVANWLSNSFWPKSRPIFRLQTRAIFLGWLPLLKPQMFGKG